MLLIAMRLAQERSNTSLDLKFIKELLKHVGKDKTPVCVT